MGGNMSWPRFRGRNGLAVRPNYFSANDRAPAFTPNKYISQSLDSAYLSGELDRMVYGWWLSSQFQAAVAEHVGVSVDQVAAVQAAMLRWDFLDGDPGHWGDEP